MSLWCGSGSITDTVKVCGLYVELRQPALWLNRGFSDNMEVKVFLHETCIHTGTCYLVQEAPPCAKHRCLRLALDIKPWRSCLGFGYYSGEPSWKRSWKGPSFQFPVYPE